jgi:hypothetical protein
MFISYLRVQINLVQTVWAVLSVFCIYKYKYLHHVIDVYTCTLKDVQMTYYNNTCNYKLQ